jgi:hypothetical protein
MMTSVIVYGYAVGVRGRRKLEQACVDRVPFRFLAAGDMPKLAAISEFRRTRLSALEDLFVQGLRGGEAERLPQGRHRRRRRNEEPHPEGWGIRGRAA